MEAPPPKKRRGPYRKYLQDSLISMPKTTMWRYKRLQSVDMRISLTDDSDSCTSILNNSLDEPASCSTPMKVSSSSSSDYNSLVGYDSPDNPMSSPTELSFLLESTSLFTSSEEIHSHNTVSSPSSDDNMNNDHSHCFELPTLENNPELFEPLYLGSKISFCGAVCSIMQFCMMRKLSYTAIGELLKLLQVLCPTPNRLPSTVFQLKKFFNRFNMSYDYSNLCSNCDTKKEECNCDHPVYKSHLIHIPLEKPLCAVLTNHWEHLHSYNDCEPSVMTDVWDGAKLVELSAEGQFFSKENTLALAISVDGVPLFRSSAVSMWPVYLAILNLPPNTRMNAENMLLAGLWVGPKKPTMRLLLDPIMTKLHDLYTKGLTIPLPSGCVTVKAKLLFGTFDLPAKAAVLNCKQFNGEYGCSVCYHPGLRLPNGARVYLPYRYPERTQADVLSAAQEAESDCCAVKGILGKSPLSKLLNIVDSVPVDYMHACLEGVMRSLMNRWFKSSYHTQPYYLGRQQALIDSKLLKQHPPSEFSRPPRSIKHLPYWKASELRNWLLFYSLPLLLDCLPPLYFHHYALFVCAMHMLLSDKISNSQVEAAEQMLIDFCSFLPELYDDTICTHNAHLITHLTKYVKLFGPLWTHSTFGSENKNGCLKTLFHGKHQIHQQLLFSVDVRITLQLLHPSLSIHEDDSTMRFIDHVTNAVPRSNMTFISDHMYMVGPCKATILTDEQSQAFHCRTNSVHDTFSKLYKNGIMYASALRSRDDLLRNNTVCIFEAEDNSIQFGLIELFIAAATPEEIPTALMYKLNCQDDSILQRAGHPCRTALLEYQEANLLKNFIVAVEFQFLTITAVKVDRICGKVVVLEIDTNAYVILQPNTFEHH